MNSPLVVPVDPSQLVELAGVFCAALSGGLSAVRQRFDIVGVLVLAWATGLGGGMLRDIVIGAIPPAGIADWRLVATAVAAGIVIFFLHPRIEKMRRVMIVLDAGALALFVLNGTMKGLAYDVGPLAAIFAGVLTGVGGGVLRDLFTSEVPLIFQDRQLYAIPALFGAGITAILGFTGHLTVAAQVIVVGVVFGFRLVSLRLGWAAPRPPGAELSGTM